MSGISTHIDKGQKRFAPKVGNRARPNRNRDTASEDSTPAPTPTIGSSVSESGSFGASLLESETSSPLLSPIATPSSSTFNKYSTQSDKNTPSSTSESIPASASSSAAVAPIAGSSYQNRTSIQKPGERSTAGSGASEEAESSFSSPQSITALKSKSVITSPSSAKGGSIISVPSTREREDDEDETGSSTQNRKRPRGKPITVRSSRQQQADEGDQEEAVAVVGEGGEEDEEEEDSEFPDYSNTPMYEFVKDMGVGRRSVMFLERQKKIDEDRQKAKLEKREQSARASQTPGPREGDDNQDEDDQMSRQGTPHFVEEKKTKRELSMPLPPPKRTLAPQVRVVDGEIVLDMDSLTVDHAAVDGEDPDQSPMEYVEENASTKLINSASFAKGNRGEKWTDEETEKFYMALSQWGTDFGIIHRMFNKKTRINVRNKFKREERLNPARVQQALNQKAPVNLEEYSALTQKEFPELEGDVDEAIKKMHENELERRAELAQLNGDVEDDEYSENQGTLEAEEEIVEDDNGEEIVGELEELP
ncbi:Transcription factor TFIIIB component B [Gryganskiella cystojenkinii]|nr:Transcription factor TFIIIB component B [Gryganskiella cystojenkinii]